MFFAELKRRRVVRAGLVYGAAAFAAMQAADLLVPALHLPAWINTAIAVVALAGVPVTLALAWILDVSTDGVRVTPPGSTTPASARWLDARTIAAAGALLITGVALGVAVRPRTSSDDRSIAVLPFDNLSESKENEFFSDGITEDIISQLALLADLAVTSRTSVMPYKKSDLGVRAIAEQLGVAHILEGSVRREGKKLRITAQLIEARTDRHLWVQTFDRDLEDVFAIQSEVAREIASALRARLSPAERERLLDAPTNNTVAYDLFLRAREMAYGTADQARVAIELFRQAIELDPEFAHAYGW
ncbi:MAG: hypothetical protein WEE89_13890, partial [Gemmatimonadota bacterium]